MSNQCAQLESAIINLAANNASINETNAINHMAKCKSCKKLYEDTKKSADELREKSSSPHDRI
jgi:rRNA maturation endonuclease Nob1